MRYGVKKFFNSLLKLFAVFLVIMGGYFLKTNYQNLKQVHKYDEIIFREAKKNHISDYAGLLSSIMLTESKGIGTDPMQSSESIGENPNKFQSPERSIEQGVAFFSQALNQSKLKDTDLWTAVQAYNFGLDYIDYVSNHGGVHKKSLAESYSRDVLSKKLGNQTKQQYHYFTIHSFMYNGGYLYHNGGNMFYADIVKVNQFKWQLTDKFFNKMKE